MNKEAAKIDVQRMMFDDDVLSLSDSVWKYLLWFATKIIDASDWSDSCSVAVFGDNEEDLGEFTLVDREHRKEMQSSIAADGTADFWLLSDSKTKATLKRQTIEGVPAIVNKFQEL